MPRFRLGAADSQVLRLLGHGRTYDEIAVALHLSRATVAYHALRMQTRLGVPNNVALVAAAMAWGLLANDQYPAELTGLMEIDVHSGD